MKQIEAKQLIPEISHVKYAGGKYRVAEIKTMPGNAIFIGIYDEPPSLHVDYLNADNVEFVKEWLDESPTSPPTAHTEELPPSLKDISALVDKLDKHLFPTNSVTEELSTPKATESESENDENIWEWAAIFYFNLKALIDLKKYKEDNGKDDYYLENQPKQWYSAQQVIDLWKKSGYGAFPASQFTPHKEGYSVEDIKDAYKAGNKTGLAGYSMLSKHTEYDLAQFLNQLKK